MQFGSMKPWSEFRLLVILCVLFRCHSETQQRERNPSEIVLADPPPAPIEKTTNLPASQPSRLSDHPAVSASIDSSTDVRAVPAFKSGKLDGYKLFSIRPGSVYQRNGLKNGDLIKSVNGQSPEVIGVNEGVRIFSSLRPSAIVEVERQGAIHLISGDKVG
jgi:type II secretory pathway component PulC